MISVFITLLNAHFIGTMQLWTAILAYQKIVVAWRPHDCGNRIGSEYRCRLSSGYGRAVSASPVRKLVVATSE